MPPLSVLMTTEGTYPYGAGGVSTWCDALIRNTPDVRYVLLPIMMNPHIEMKFEPCWSSIFLIGRRLLRT